MRRRRLISLLLIRWGFAVLVAVAIAIGLVAALTVTPPVDVPTVALQAPVIYRVEVGAAVFLGLYLTTMAFALALQNRGFTEIGTGGIRARELSEVSHSAVDGQVEMDLIAELKDEVNDLRSWQEGREYVH
jgi:hypothetical protein